MNERAAPSRLHQAILASSESRLLIAGLVMLLIHLLFLLTVAPRLSFDHLSHRPTEVVQISPQELNRLKDQILDDRQKAALLKQEVLERFRTKEPPKDAAMLGPFNQQVPKEMVAGPRANAPQDGGGGGVGAQPRSRAEARPPKPMNLSDLGLGNKVPKPLMQAPDEPQARQAPVGPAGPAEPFNPVGRDAKNVERGNQNLLNAVESEFYSFFARVEDPIIRNWYFLLRSNDMRLRQEMVARKVYAGQQLLVTIEFVLDRQGNFRSISVVESSEVPVLDWATKESVRKLGSLPNPPPALFEGGQYYSHRLRFLVNVEDSPMFETRPNLYY